MAVGTKVAEKTTAAAHATGNERHTAHAAAGDMQQRNATSAKLNFAGSALSVRLQRCEQELAWIPLATHPTQPLTRPSTALQPNRLAGVDRAAVTQ
jgi:hypothetical protein